MANIIGIPPASISTGEITVSLTPPSAGSTTISTGETTGVFNIPAGCYWVRIRNAGFVQDGDQEEEATINGGSWSVGREEFFQATLDEVAGVYKKLPAIAINGNGSRVFYSYSN
jgi:hypothetical protein